MSDYTRPTVPPAAAAPHSPTASTAPPARAMLKAVGFTDDDLAKPLIGVANTGSKSCPATTTCASSPST